MDISSCLQFFLFVSSVSGLILPLTKPNGDPDLASLISHVTMLEQSMTSLQTQVQTTEIELTTVKDKLQTTEDELKVVKSDLSTAKTDIAILKHDLQKGPDPVELTNLKSEFETLKLSYNSNAQQINLTVIDSLSRDVKSNKRKIQSINTRQNTTEKDLTTTKSVVQTAVSDVKTVQSQVNLLFGDLNTISQQVSVVNKLTETDQTKQNITDQDLTATKALVQSVSAEVKSIMSQVNSISDDVNVVVKDLAEIKNRTETDQTKQNITDQDLTATKALVQSTSAEVKSIKSQINSISDDVNAVIKDLTVIKNRTDKDVAFQVTQRASGGSSGWSILKFDSVDYNAGAGYVNSTGMFNAPVSGTYIIWANVMYESPKTSFYTYIKKGQQTLAIGYYQMSNDNIIGVASSLTVTHLDKGEQVHFTTDRTNEYIYGDGYSSYGGALLHAV